MEVQRLNSSSLEGGRKIPAGRKSTSKGTEVGEPGTDSGTSKSSSLDGDGTMYRVGRKVAEKAG